MSTEVCLSYNQDVPICRSIKNSNDPTGCAGLCIIDQEICQKLDNQNAYRYLCPKAEIWKWFWYMINIAVSMV